MLVIKGVRPGCAGDIDIFRATVADAGFAGVTSRMWRVAVSGLYQARVVLVWERLRPMVRVSRPPILFD